MSQEAMENQVGKLWAEMLNIKSINFDDDFFALGGTSLLATKLMFKVYEVFSVELPLSIMAEGLTIKKMAVAIQADSTKDLERDVGVI